MTNHFLNLKYIFKNPHWIKIKESISKIKVFILVPTLTRSSGTPGWARPSGLEVSYPSVKWYQVVLRAECSSCLCKLLTREYCPRRRFVLAPDAEESLPLSRRESSRSLGFSFFGDGTFHLILGLGLCLPLFPTKRRSRSAIVLQVRENPYQAGLDNKNNSLTHVTERSNWRLGLRSGWIQGSHDVTWSLPLSCPLLCFHDVRTICRWLQWEDFFLPHTRGLTLPDWLLGSSVYPRTNHWGQDDEK